MTEQLKNKKLVNLTTQYQTVKKSIRILEATYIDYANNTVDSVKYDEMRPTMKLLFAQRESILDQMENVRKSA